MNKYFWRRVVFGGVLLLLVFFLLRGVVTLIKNENIEPIRLDAQSAVVHEIRYTAQPVFEGKAEPFYIDVMIESNEHPDVLEVLYKDTTLLETSLGETLTPSEWEVISEELHLLKGRLLFPAFAESVPTFSVTFFGEEDVTFVWSMMQ